ncbi:hypothetical protein [Demequina aurantiaca]|uniref:hypothetical protein n=1 Tax=Demequina aurantiaca TaxID=676200 RepID=UPI00078532A1|nr:hypothetical protein [Demequina aurantiaca]
MSQIQDTQIEGSPAAIEAVATYLRTTLSGASSTWAGDVASGRTKASGAWSGETAEAFAGRLGTAKKAITSFGDETDAVAAAVSKLATGLTNAQQKMTDARATASAGGLTVSGTKIHGPGNAPATQFATTAPYTQTPASTAAGSAYSKKVKAWNTSVQQATSGFDMWQEALDAFSATWSEKGSNLTSVTTGLLTGGISAGAIANTTYQLKGVRALNLDRLASAEATLAQMVKDGRVVVPKSAYYGMADDALAARTAATSADDLLKDGVRVGSKLSKGLLVLGIAGTGYGIYDDIQHGESVAQAATSNVGGFLAGVGAGAAIGSFIAPPAGTIVGAVVGAGIGLFTSGMIDHFFEDGWGDGLSGVGDALESGWNEVADTGKAIGDLATGVWDSIF